MGLCPFPSTHVPSVLARLRSHVREMAAARDARQRSGPGAGHPFARRRSGPDSTGSGGGWGDGDAILSALEGPGSCRSSRGCRVTWHSRRFNAGAGAASPVVERVLAPRIPSRSFVRHASHRAVGAVLSSSAPLPSRSACRERERKRPGDAPDPFCSCPSRVPPPPWASPSPPSSPASLARSRCAF